MSKQSVFFQEATQILTNSLNLSVVLPHLYSFLQQEMPITLLSISRFRQDLQVREPVAVCSAEGVTVFPIGTFVPTTNAQEAIRPELNKVWSSPQGIMVTDKSHLAVRFATLGGKDFSPAQVPFFMLRLLFESSERILFGPETTSEQTGAQDSKAVGGVIFGCQPDQPFTEKHLDLLRSLRLPLRLTLDNCFQHRALHSLAEDARAENERLRQQLCGLSSVQVIGGGEGLVNVMERARLAAAVDVPVLITGETGTGKELIARVVHDLSPRRKNSFVAVNCGGIPSSLIDSELFGHVKGAFTGASNNHKGRFERAHNGTIFLDEIGELPLDVQARLLRVLQDMTIERVGGTAAVPVNFRLVAATHRDLAAMVREGTFRNDLYYRLNVVPVYVPPLRERVRDIPLLVDHLVRSGATRFGIPVPPIGQGEMGKLLAYHWPGNVRELQNTIEEALVLLPCGPLRFHNAEQTTPPDVSAPDAVVSWEKVQHDYFTGLLKTTAGRINGERGAAVLSGLNPSTFRFKLAKLGIPYGRSV